MTGRREFLGGLAAATASAAFPPLVVSVQAMFDQGAHSGRGLGEAERSKFRGYQNKADRDFAVSGIRFQIRFLEGAYLRRQGYSVIPAQFLAHGAINLFITDALGYDIDRTAPGAYPWGPFRPAADRAAIRFIRPFSGCAMPARTRLSTSTPTISRWTPRTGQPPRETSGPIYGTTTGSGGSAAARRFPSSGLARIPSGHGLRAEATAA